MQDAGDSRVAEIPRVAIVGGGITGLAAAHRLMELSMQTGRKVEVVLIEPASRLGGVIGTEQVEGYQLETGADMFITDKPWGLSLVRRLGLEDRLVVPDPKFRKSMILCHGRPVETPEAFNLMVPGKLWPIIKTPLLSPLGKLRLMCEPFIARASAEVQSSDESLADFVRRRLGREAFERIVQPLVGGIYTADPEKLSLEATLPRFQVLEREFGSLYWGMRAQQKQKRRSKAHQGAGGRKDFVSDAGDGAGEGGDAASGARYGLFVSFQTGMSELIDRIEERVLAGGVQRLRAEVSAVTRVGEQYQLRLVVGGGSGVDSVGQGSRSYGNDVGSKSEENSRGEVFDAVVLAVPTHRAATLLRGEFGELAWQLEGVEHASSAVVVTAHRNEQIAHPLDCYGLVVPQVERRKVLAVSVLTKKFPQRAPVGRTVLRTFVGGALQPELMSLTDEAMVDIVRAELRDIFGVQGEPELSRVVRYPVGMPQYHVGHQERVRGVESAVSKLPGLWLCGKGYRGVGIPDCIHDGEQTVEAAWRSLFPALEKPGPVA